MPPPPLPLEYVHQSPNEIKTLSVLFQHNRAHKKVKHWFIIIIITNGRTVERERRGKGFWDLRCNESILSMLIPLFLFT